MNSNESIHTEPSIAELQAENIQLREKNQLLEQEIERLHYYVSELKRIVFGVKKEKFVSPSQESLFSDLDIPQPPSPETETLTFERRKSKKIIHPHHVIPDHLPRVRQEYQLSETERQCPCGCGTLLEKFDEEISERIEMISAKIYVKQHVRFKYAGCPFDSTVLTASMPTLPINRCIAGPSLISNIAVDKYGYHLPLHRQQQRFKNLGAHFHVNSLYDWVNQAATLLKSWYDVATKTILLSPIINTDDTPVKVRIDGSDKTKNGYLWIYIGHGHECALAIYVYTETRQQIGPQKFLEKYTGYVQADAYQGYDILFQENQPHPKIEVGCWMHARRGFYKIVQQSKKPGAAHQAMAWIQQLYKIERECKSFSPEDRLTYRQQYSVPLLNEFKKWLDIKMNQAMPKTPLHDAVQYGLNHWQALMRYTEDGRLEIDNGSSERGMRPVALGRNNWISLGSHRGGEIAAIFYSVIESCKIHGINPYEYLTDVLTRINDHPINQLEQLLPYQWLKGKNATKQNDTS